MPTEEISAELIEDIDVLKFRSQTIDDECKNLSFIQPFGYVLTNSYLQYHDQIQNFEVFEDDVWIATYPKCGTRWTQELVWCLRNGIDKAKESPLHDRAPFFEFNVIDNKKLNEKDSFGHVENLQRPRTIKTHFAYDMLPKQVHEKKAKIINVVRNPRDVCLSYQNHMEILEKYTGDVQTIANILTKDVGLSWGPFFKHILSYWNQKTQENLLIVSYEEMQDDLPAVIKTIAKFLEIDVTEECVEKLADHLSFKSMKANPMTNLQTEIQKTDKIGGNDDNAKSMLNKGKSGRWRKTFSPEMIKQFDEWEAKWLKDQELKQRLRCE